MVEIIYKILKYTSVGSLKSRYRINSFRKVLLLALKKHHTHSVSWWCSLTCVHAWYKMDKNFTSITGKEINVNLITNPIVQFFSTVWSASMSTMLFATYEAWNGMQNLIHIHLFPLQLIAWKSWPQKRSYYILQPLKAPKKLNGTNPWEHPRILHSRLGIKLKVHIIGKVKSKSLSSVRE